MRSNRLAMALLAYAILGGLTWITISNEKLRLATLLILALFALKTLLRRNDVLHGDGKSGE